MILERRYQDEELLSTRHCTIEHGDGSGIRRCSHSTDIGVPASVEISEGIATGLEYPDRTTFLFGASTLGFVIRREVLEDGDLWTIDSLPGARMPGIRFHPDSLLVRRDSLGREVERRMVPRGGRNAMIRRTQWGPWGAVVQSEASNGETRVDSTTWNEGAIVRRIRYRWTGFDSLPSRETFDWREGRIVRSTYVHRYKSPLDSPDRVSWDLPDSLGDTLRITQYADGSDTLHMPRGLPRDTTRRGDTLVVTSGGTSGTRRAFATPEGASTPQLVRHTEYVCESGSCRDAWHSAFEYATLDATVVSLRQGKPPRVTVQQVGKALRWSGPIADQASLELRSLDGRIRATTRFRNGVAGIERGPAGGVLIWRIVPEAGRPVEGSILLR